MGRTEPLKTKYQKKNRFSPRGEPFMFLQILAKRLLLIPHNSLSFKCSLFNQEINFHSTTNNPATFRDIAPKVHSAVGGHPESAHEFSPLENQESPENFDS